MKTEKLIMNYAQSPISRSKYRFENLTKEDPIVEIKLRSKISIGNNYFASSLPGSLPRVYIRSVILDKIYSLLKKLPSGYSIHIFDAFRSLETQQAIFDLEFL